MRCIPLSVEQLKTMVDAQYKYLQYNIREKPQQFILSEKLWECFPDSASLSLLERKGLAIKVLFTYIPLPQPQDYELIVGNLFPYVSQNTEGYPRYWTSEDKIVKGWCHLGHCAPDYNTFLHQGLAAVYKNIEFARETAKKTMDSDRLDFFQGQMHALEGMEIWAKRLLEVYCNAGLYYKDIAERLQKVTKGEPENFPQALQNAWFLHAALQNNSTPCAIGPMDQFLWPYLQHDLESKKISLEEAQCWIDAYILKFSERNYIGRESRSFGDTGFQNVILGGKTCNGEDRSNFLSIMILKSLEKFKVIEPKITVRLFPKKMSDNLRHQVCKTIKTGGGQPAIYNDNTLLPALLSHGWGKDAYDYATDGCWETTMPGKSSFFWLPVDLLALLLESITNNSHSMENFDILLNEYLQSIESRIQALIKTTDSIRFITALRGPLFSQDAKDRLNSIIDEIMQHGLPREDRLSLQGFHCLQDGDVLFSAFVRGTIESGRDMMSFGSEKNIFAIVARAIANVADSLVVIKKAVFEENKISLEELQEILLSNYRTREELRQSFIYWYPKYGNDIEEVDYLASQITNFLIDSVERNSFLCPHKNVYITVGVATYGWDVDMGKEVGASPDGRLSQSPIANNMSPSTGMALNGASAILNSFSKLPGERFSAGAPIDIFLEPAMVKEESGLLRLAGFIETFLEKKGNLLSINIVSAEDLKKAKQNPDRYSSLRVRMGGWQAYFVSLSEEVQDFLIKKAEQH